MNDDLLKEYLNWVGNLVDIHDEEFLNKLDSVDFWFDREFDGNRLQDGIDLRYRFGYERGISSDTIKSELMDKGCSFLEMAAALSLRLEENIMYDPECGDRTGKWFGEMLDGLYISKNNTVDYIQFIVDAMIEGKVPLFKDTFASDEIWMQAVKHLNRNYHVTLVDDI